MFMFTISRRNTGRMKNKTHFHITLEQETSEFLNSFSRTKNLNKNQTIEKALKLLSLRENEPFPGCYKALVKAFNEL